MLRFEWRGNISLRDSLCMAIDYLAICRNQGAVVCTMSGAKHYLAASPTQGHPPAHAAGVGVRNWTEQPPPPPPADMFPCGCVA